MEKQEFTTKAVHDEGAETGQNDLCCQVKHLLSLSYARFDMSLGQTSSKIIGCNLLRSQSSSASSVVTSPVKPIENTCQKTGNPKWWLCLT